MKCSACGKGKLTEEIEDVQVVINGKQHSVKSKFSICDYCGSELANAKQLKFNKEQVEKIKNNDFL